MQLQRYRLSPQLTVNHSTHLAFFSVFYVLTSCFLATASSSRGSSASHAHVVLSPALVQDCVLAVCSEISIHFSAATAEFQLSHIFSIILPIPETLSIIYQLA
jgi:hypothetical protein